MKHVMLIIVVLAIFLTGTANALVTKTFDDVKDEAELRLGNLPLDNLTKDQKKEKKSLEKALKYFAKDSTTSKKDAKLIQNIVKVLVKQYPLDQDMTDLLGTGLDAFLAEIDANLAHYKKGQEVLDDANKKKKAADKKMLKADEASQMAGAATDPKEKAKLVKKCEGKVAGAGKATGKALGKQELTAHQEKFLMSAPGAYVGAATCIGCHTDAGTEMLAAGHWKWEGTTANVVGFETRTLGKNQIINNFCIAIPSNEGRCTQCHPGYGYKDKNFDFNDADALDCLVCHDTTGLYKKDKKTAGNPVAGTDLTKVAANAGKPGIANCGACHFTAGGGDNVKKGDLGSSLLTATKDADVHMGSAATGGGNFSCTECHQTTDHKIPGNQLQDAGRVACTDCHSGANAPTASIHTTSHLAKVGCQTCHIPTFSRQMATKTHWDWSTAGDAMRTPVLDANGKPDYDKMKGDFEWGKDVTPAYMWYSGMWTKTFIGENDTYTGTSIVLGAPVGDMTTGKIYPFKKMTGVQGGDAVNKRVLVPHLFGLTGGPNPYWVKYEWDGAFADGAAYTNLPYSGTYEWIDTVMYLAINHEVAPKEQAIGSCGDCHGQTPAKISLQDLGYTADPMTGQDYDK